MADTGKIVKGVGITAIVGLLVWKGVSLYNKVKIGVTNITPNVSFLRVHGLIGDGITKFLSPTIRTLFNLNIKNFSGFDIDVTKIYAKIEVSKDGGKNYKSIATTSNYINISIPDGKEINKELTIDFKGLSTISSLMNKNNSHRILLSYNYKGQALQTTQDIDISGQISSYWQKIKGSFSLKGITVSQALQTV